MPLLNAPFNNFSVTKKMLIEPISIEEAINNDYYDNLTQNEQNLLIERKFDAIKHLPFQFNNNFTVQNLAKTFISFKNIMKQILILILMMKQFQMFMEIELMLYGHL